MWLLCTTCSRYLQQWSILPCTAKSSNRKHRKGSCGGGVRVQQFNWKQQEKEVVAQTVVRIGKPFDMLQSWSKHEFKCRYRHLSESCEAYNSGSHSGAAKVPKATDIWETALHELKLTKHAEGPLDVKKSLSELFANQVRDFEDLPILYDKWLCFWHAASVHILDCCS